MGTSPVGGRRVYFLYSSFGQEFGRSDQQQKIGPSESQAMISHEGHGVWPMRAAKASWGSSRHEEAWGQLGSFLAMKPFLVREKMINLGPQKRQVRWLLR